MIALISCYKCGATGHITRECQGNRICFRRKQPGHSQRECPQPHPASFAYACWGCGSSDHFLPNCPKLRCEKCNKPGHFTSYCPKLRCRRCHETGHYTKYCPRPLKYKSTSDHDIPQPDEHVNQQAQARNVAELIDSIATQIETLLQRFTLHVNNTPPQTNEHPRRPATSPLCELSPRRVEATPPPRRADAASPHATPQVIQQPVPPLDTRARAEDLARQGDVAFEKNVLYTALARYNEATKLDNQDAALFEKRAIVLMKMRRFRDAESDLQRALFLQVAPPNTQILFHLGRVNYELGFFGPAQHYASQALAQDPNNESIRALLMKVNALCEAVDEYQTSMAQRNWCRASTAHTMCIRLAINAGATIPVEWNCWKIDRQIAQGNWQDALITAKYILIIHPNSADLVYRQGLLLFYKANIPEAKQALHHVLRLDPDNAPAKALWTRVRLVDRLKAEGKKFYSAEKWEKALETYTKCLEMTGSDISECGGGFLRAILLSNRAATLMRLGKLLDAWADVQASLRLNPSLIKALWRRGRLCMLAEYYESAVKDLQQAFELSVPSGVPKGLKEELAQAKAMLERTKRGPQDYYSVLGVRPTSSAADITRAFRRLGLQHHPDKGGDEEKFKVISEAYNVLSNAEERRRYDLRKSWA